MSAIYLMLMLLCADQAIARDVVECSVRRGGNAHYWSWRQIEGRVCWYVGRPGKPKSELYWPNQAPSEHERASEAAARPEGGVDTLAAAPAVTPPPPTEELTESALMAAGIQRLLMAEPPRERERNVLPLPVLPPKREPVWPIWFLVSLVIATVGVAFLLPIMRSLRNG